MRLDGAALRAARNYRILRRDLLSLRSPELQGWIAILRPGLPEDPL